MRGKVSNINQKEDNNCEVHIIRIFKKYIINSHKQKIQNIEENYFKMWQNRNVSKFKKK